MMLQLAVDCRNIEEMVGILDAAAAYADIIEAGTPLIISEGLKAVREIKRRYPNKQVLADVKIMDAGGYQAEMVCQAGADIVTVMGAAGNATIQEAVRATHAAGKKLAVDTLGMANPVDRCVEVDGLGADIVCLHTSFDESERTPPPERALAELRKKEIHAMVTVTGGVSLDNIGPLISLDPDIIIVGRSITYAENREQMASQFQKRINAAKR